MYKNIPLVIDELSISIIKYVISTQCKPNVKVSPRHFVKIKKHTYDTADMIILFYTEISWQGTIKLLHEGEDVMFSLNL